MLELWQGSVSATGLAEEDLMAALLEEGAADNTMPLEQELEMQLEQTLVSGIISSWS